MHKHYLIVRCVMQPQQQWCPAWGRTNTSVLFLLSFCFLTYKVSLSTVTRSFCRHVVSHLFFITSLLSFALLLFLIFLCGPEEQLAFTTSSHFFFFSSLSWFSALIFLHYLLPALLHPHFPHLLSLPAALKTPWACYSLGWTISFSPLSFWTLHSAYYICSVSLISAVEEEGFRSVWSHWVDTDMIDSLLLSSSLCLKSKCTFTATTEHWTNIRGKERPGNTSYISLHFNLIYSAFFHIFHYRKCLHEALYTTPLSTQDLCPLIHNVQYLIHACRNSVLISFYMHPAQRWTRPAFWGPNQHCEQSCRRGKKARKQQNSMLKLF